MTSNNLPQSSIWKQEQDEEMEALQAIFMDDLILAENAQSVPSFKIMVSSRPGGATPANTVVEFVITSLPVGYPTSAPLSKDDLQLEGFGKVSQGYLREIKDVLLKESERLLQEGGGPQIFLLVEKMKDFMEECMDTSVDGDFRMLSDEELLHVMDYLQDVDLGRMATLNRNFHRIAADPSLWEALSFGDGEYNNYVKSHGINADQVTDWKALYLDMKNLRAGNYEFVVSVVGRKGTGDEWPVHYGSWREYFKEEMTLKFGIKMTARGQIIRKDDETPSKGRSSPLGYFNFADNSSRYAGASWYQKCQQEAASNQCPYTGEILGFVFFSSEWQTVLGYLLQVARGTLVQISNVTSASDLRSMPAIRKESVLVANLLHNGRADREYDGLESAGLLVDPRSATKQIPYLNAIVSGINRKIELFKFKGDDKRKKLIKASSRAVLPHYVEFNTKARLYPMILSEYGLLKMIEETLWMKVWVNNSDFESFFGSEQK